VPFPKANVTQIRWMAIEDLVAVAESAGQELLKHFKGQIESAANASRPPAAATVLNRALQAATGRKPTDAAIRAAHKVIVAGLKRLNDSIPLLSPFEDPPAYGERRRWNHVWLVDPLDGRDAFAGGRSEFTVNIGLVEDGQPIYGVVHAPAKGTTYFGRVGKGALKRIGGAMPARISAPTDAPDPNMRRESGETAPEGSSRALAMCALLEQPAPVAPDFGPVPEWRAAAAQAILSAAEVQTGEGASGAAHLYNSRELVVGPLNVRPEVPA
jgi:3'(2'), 5'-bisphosphate nucleotidase